MAHTYISESHRAYSEACRQIIEETAKHPKTAEVMLAQCIRNKNAALQEHNFIFMEIDGVMTSEKHNRELLKDGWPIFDGYCPELDPGCVASLEAILKSDKDAVIILLSRKPKSRYYGIYKGSWIRGDRPGEIYDYIEVDNCGNKGKGKTLSFWMQDHGVTDKKYVILCSEDEFLEDQQAHFIKTSQETGLTREDAQRAIEMLKARETSEDV